MRILTFPQNHSTGQFMGGRFLLGFGVAIVSAAGPIYVVESSHPAYRGIATAYCNTFWFTGAILSSGAVRGALDLKGNITWQLPIWLQMMFPGLIAIFCLLIPESPRWLYVSGNKEKARKMLTRWHGYGNPESEWVKLELAEYDEYLNLEGSVSISLWHLICAELVAGQTMVGLSRFVQHQSKPIQTGMQRLLLDVCS